MGANALMTLENDFLQSTWLLESLFSVLHSGLWALVGGVCDTVRKVCNINVPSELSILPPLLLCTLNSWGVCVLINVFFK